MGLFACLWGCIQHPDQETIESIDPLDSGRVELKVQYAQGFDLKYQKNGMHIVTHSFGTNTPFADSLQIGFSNGNEQDENSLNLTAEGLRIACQSSTHLSFIKALNATDKVCALCGIKYVTDKNLQNTLAANQVIEICQGEGVLMEPLLAAEPDVYLTYPFQSTSENANDVLGIHDLFIAEYLEKTPLARLEWIKLFGVLLEKEGLAKKIFDEKKTLYLDNQSKAVETGQTFIMNLPFQDNWYMPSSQSLVVNLIEDAGLSYLYADEKGTENILHSKESVWSDGGVSDYWIIIAARPAQFSMDDLISEAPAYRTFAAVQKNQVIFCNTSQVPYFTRGVLEPEIMLKDLLFATGQIEQHDPVYFRLLQ